MKTTIVVLFILAITAIIISLATLILVIIKLDKYDSILDEHSGTIKDHKVDIENFRQGGQLQLKRLQKLEEKLGVTPE